MGTGTTEETSMMPFIYAALLSRGKDTSIVQSYTTGSLWYVPTKDMQVKVSIGTKKPIRDKYGHCQIRVPSLKLGKKYFGKNIWGTCED